MNTLSLDDPSTFNGAILRDIHSNGERIDLDFHLGESLSPHDDGTLTIEGRNVILSIEGDLPFISISRPEKQLTPLRYLEELPGDMVVLWIHLSPQKIGFRMNSGYNIALEGNKITLSEAPQ